MKKTTRIYTALLTCLFLIPSLVLADDPLRDPFYSQGSSISASDMNTVTERVDPFSGILTLAHTDLHLPGNGGLDLNLIRTYNSMIWGRRDTSFPGLIAKNERSPLGIGWTMHMGIVSNPFGTGSSNRFLPDNPVVVMPDGSRHIFYKDKNDSTRFISKDFWIYKYISGGSGYGTWELTLSDGTVYTLEYMTGNAGYNVVDSLNNVIDRVAQVTRIRNAANTASITVSYYNSNGYSFLRTITDSASRTITLNYDYTAHKLTSITVDSRTFNYGYTTLNGDNYLSTFTPPTGNAWTYGYETGVKTYELNSITYPTGGRIDYTYSDTFFKTGTVNVSFRVVSGRATSGRGITGGTWNYSYNSGSSNGDVTTINAPGVTETHTFYGWGNTGSSSVWKVGLPISRTYSGNFTLSEAYSWVQGTQISNDEISNANWSGSGGSVYDTAIYVPFNSYKSITRDDKAYTTTYSSFDTYGNPQSVSESGDADRSRTVSYWSNAIKNIVSGKPSSETITGTFPGTSTSSWTYDSNSGNVTQTTKDGVTTGYGYNVNGNLSSVTDANSHTISYEWNYGKISRETNSFYSVYRTINSNGTVATVTNGRNFLTSYSYDGNLRQTGITPPVGNSTSISYPADSSYRRETRGSYSTDYTFDGFGRPSGSSDSRGITSSIVYTAYGTKDYEDSNVGDKIVYDHFGRVKSIIHKDNNTIAYAYSSSNVTITDENNASKLLTYSAFGNPDEKYLMSVRDEGNNTTSYARNIQGNITGITQGATTRSFGYDSTKKYYLTSETNPETGTISYGRDNVGNMTSKSDSSGTKSYTYDAINRLTGISSGASSISFGYDNADNRTSTSSPAASFTYSYDGANRLTSKSETVAGRSYSLSYGYDGNDNVTSITYPSSRSVTLGVNGNNQVTSVTGFVTSVTYSTSGTNAGLPTAYTLANNLTTNLTYSSRRLVTGITAGTSALNVGYGHDTRGNTTSMTNSLEPAKNQTFSYDSLSRITGFNGAWGSGSYGYDALGNRTNKTVAGASTTYSYSSNRLSSASGGESGTYSYSGNGLLTGGAWQGGSYTLTYDAFDNLASYKLGGNSLADFAYDGDGMRVSKTSSGRTTVYHYDQGGSVLSENFSDGTFIADYIYLNGKLVAKVAATPTISVSPTYDNLGNVYVNTTSPADTITISNNGTADLEIGIITLSGTDAASFAKSSDGCSGQTLLPSATCTVRVTFTPTSTGNKAATLVIPSNDNVNANSTVTLNGTGVYPTLTISKTGVGTGTVTSSPAGISCGATCSGSFTTGSSVTLTAVPGANSVFSGWSGGGCSGTGSCTVVLNTDTTVTASFALNNVTVSVQFAGNGGGTVTSTPAGIACSQNCSAQFTSGTVLTLSPAAASTSTFNGWSNGVCSGTGNCVTNLSSNIAVTATFTAWSKIGTYKDSGWYLDVNGNKLWDAPPDKNYWFGVVGDIPVAGDWAGSGTTKIGVFNPASAAWYLDNNGNGAWDGPTIDRYFSFGYAGVKPVVGNWSGSGATKIGVYDPTTNTWLLDYDGSGTWNPPVDKVYTFGATGVIPVTGDWNGDGRTEIGYYNPANQIWRLDYNGDGTWNSANDREYSFGLTGVIPAPGDWNGSGRTKIGVHDPAAAVWYLDINGNGVWDGVGVDASASFGYLGSTPVIGNW